MSTAMAKRDLAVSNYMGGTVSVLLGKGDGSFHRGPALRCGGFVTALDIDDFNADGKPDLAATHFNGVAILLNAADWPPLPIGGGNTFESPAEERVAFDKGEALRQHRPIVVQNADVVTQRVTPAHVSRKIARVARIPGQPALYAIDPKVLGDLPAKPEDLLL